MRQTLGIRISESRIMLIHVFYMLKTNDIQFKLSNKHAYARKGIRHNVFFTFNVLDDIWKRLNKFNPLSMMLVQLGLTLKSLMIGMNDKLMGMKVMFPFMQIAD